MNKKFLKYLIDFDALIYYHLFSLISSENLEYYLTNFKESIDNGEEHWFERFHKAMRQTDFFEINGKGEGHLDMIFWNYIHESKKDLHKLIIDFFENEF